MASKRIVQGCAWALAAALTVALAHDARAQGATVAAATDEQKQAAQQAFLAALEKSKAGDHEGALAGFRASFAVVESPNTQLMIGRELAALNKLADAYRAIRAAEKLAQDASTVDAKYVEAAKAAALEADEMKKRIGMLRIDAGDLVVLEITVQGQNVPVDQKGELIPVDPGKVPVVLRSAKGIETREVDAMAGSESVADFKPATPPPPAEDDPSASGGFDPFDGGSDQRTTAYVVGGVGAAGMVLFGVFGALHLSTFGDLEDQCPGNVCPASLQGDADSGKTYQTVANVGLVVGAVGLAAGTALFVTTLIGDDEPTSASRPPPLQLGVGPTGLSLRGSF
jgi:hypothetical protein